MLETLDLVSLQRVSGSKFHAIGPATEKADDQSLNASKDMINALTSTLLCI